MQKRKCKIFIENITIFLKIPWLIGIQIEKLREFNDGSWKRKFRCNDCFPL